MKKLPVAIGMIVALLAALYFVEPRQAGPTETIIEPSNEPFVGEAKLEKISDHFQAYVDSGKLVGLTTLIAEKGKIVHFSTYGSRIKDTPEPTQKDTIYRLYSMSKPITSAALMVLWEEGKFDLDDPISKYMPAMANPQVYVSGDSLETLISHPAKQGITIRQLMTHTSGHTYGVFGNHPVDQAYRAAGLQDPTASGAILMKRLADLPLMFEPGSRYHYGVAVDIQGRLIEVISGQSLGDFLKERIFDPLGMEDTGFHIGATSMNRLSGLYTLDSERNTIQMGNEYGEIGVQRPAFEAGGSGLVSTTMDYWRFAQMLVNEGSLDDVRILKPETVALMTRNHLPASAPRLNNSESGPSRGLSFGLGFAVVEDSDLTKGASLKGNYYWSGLASTVFWVDPTNDVVVILMTNLIPNQTWPLREDMRDIIYAPNFAE